jgi:transposase-like protein
MKTVELELRVANETGTGILVRFQPKPNYTEAIGFYCPHCMAYNGIKRCNGSVISPKRIGERYETESDISFMCNSKDRTYSWTEDLRCASCGKIFSLSNGS